MISKGKKKKKKNLKILLKKSSKNFVLTNTIEYILNKETKKENKRILGQIMIAGKDIKKIWIQKKQNEEI